MTESTTAETPRRRVRRTAAAPARGTRRRPVGGPGLVDSLDQMIDQLIKENRELKRQIDRLTTRGTAVASGSVERTLRGIQRRLQRAVGGPQTRRRRTTTPRTTTTRTTTTRTTSGARRARGTAT